MLEFSNDSYNDFDFAGYGQQQQQQQLVDEYLPPSECYLENFQLTNMSNTADSFSSEMNSTSSLSFSGLNSSYGSPIMACRNFSETPSMPIYSDYSNSSYLNPSSPMDAVQMPTYRFQTIKYEPWQYDASFSSANETGDSFVESSLSEKSNHSIDEVQASPHPASNKAKKKCDKVSKTMAKEQKMAEKKAAKDQADPHGFPDYDPSRPAEPVPQLILNAILSSPNYTMQAQEIYKYITHK